MTEYLRKYSGGVPKAHMRVVKDICEGVRTRVRILMRDIDDFSIDVGLH